MFDLRTRRDIASGNLVYSVTPSVDLAFTLRPAPRTEATRLRINGLGRHADDLRRLRDGLREEAG